MADTVVRAAFFALLALPAVDVGYTFAWNHGVAAFALLFLVHQWVRAVVNR